MATSTDFSSAPTTLSNRELFQAVTCADGLIRCPWAMSTPGTLADHDGAWGTPPSTSTDYFQALMLELLDSGLARWSQTGRHPAWFLHMNHLEPHLVCRFDEDDIEALLLNPELIRNRAKIEAVVHNADVCERWTLQDWMDVLSNAQVPEPETPPLNALDLLDRSEASLRVANHLKSLGMALVGPVTAHRWLQRTAHAAGHVAGCHRLASAR